MLSKYTCSNTSRSETKLHPSILEKLNKKFKYVNITQAKAVFGNSCYSNGEIVPDYECSAAGAFTEERGRKIQISDMGSLELNILGLLCSFFCVPALTNEERAFLSAAKDSDDTFRFLDDTLGKDYVRYNLFFDPLQPVDNAINVITLGGKYDIYFVYGEKMLKLASFVQNQNNAVFKMILKELKTKKAFEETVIKDLHISGLSPKDLLKLFAIYEYKMPSRLIDVI